MNSNSYRKWYIATQYDIRLPPYDILASQAWYNIRSLICSRHISPTAGGYHIEDISPVPAGTDNIEKRQVSVETCRFSCERATKKIFLPSFRMNLNSHRNHGESRVYHQDGVLHIINSAGIVYHHCERIYSLRLMIYTFGDEMHACAWWYTIAFAMDKKSTGRNLSIFGAGKRARTFTVSQWILNPSRLPIPPYPHKDRSNYITIG